MAKRIVAGEIGGGNYGLRVSLPGQDAINGNSLQTSDKLSFDTLYPADGVFIDRIYDVTVGANTSKVVNYGKTYNPFPFILGTYKNGNTYISDLFCLKTTDSDGSTNFTTNVASATLQEGFYWETTGTQLTVYNETSSSKVFRLFLLTLGATGSAAATLPNPPTITSITNLSTTSQRVNYATTAGTEETRMDVSTVANFSSFVYQNVSIGMTSPYDVTGLSQSTTYYYRLRAVDTTPNPDVTSNNSGTVAKTTDGVNANLGVTPNSALSSDNTSPYYAETIFKVLSDGRTQVLREPGADNTYYWFGSSINSGIGNSYWVRFTENSYTPDSIGSSISNRTGALTTSGNTGWLSLSTTREIGVSVEYNSGFPVFGNADRSITAEISTNSSGTNIVSTKTFSLQVSYSN